MKKIFVVLFGLATAGQVFAAGTDICGGTAGAHDATAAVAAGGTNFVVTSFTPKCSSNTFVAYEQNQVAFVVAAASAKGKNIFTGTTGGGGVKQAAACTGGICTTASATGATAAVLAAST
jgi:hypothetical protein